MPPLSNLKKGHENIPTLRNVGALCLYLTYTNIKKHMEYIWFHSYADE